MQQLYYYIHRPGTPGLFLFIKCGFIIFKINKMEPLKTKTYTIGWLTWMLSIPDHGQEEIAIWQKKLKDIESKNQEAFVFAIPKSDPKKYGAAIADIERMLRERFGA